VDESDYKLFLGNGMLPAGRPVHTVKKVTKLVQNFVQKVSPHIICGKEQEYGFVTSNIFLYFEGWWTLSICLINSVKGG
jgi:hypothetical protein